VITEPLFYLIAVPAILISGISKGGFGGGVGILTVPAMALVVSPLQAAGIMLPLLCLMDLVGLRAYRRTWDRASMAVLAPAALAGITLGALSAGLLEESQIRLVIGVIAVSFTADYWLGRRGHEAPKARNRLKGGLLGVVSGFTSFLAHAGGPPISVYLLPLRLDKTVFVGTTVVYFAAVNYAKLAPYAWLGQLGSINLMTALVLSPLAPAGMWLGLWLHTRVSPELFYKLCYAFVFVAGCKLLYDGLAPWLGGA
jgi:uncharacterized membrane protein YfcA